MKLSTTEERRTRRFKRFLGIRPPRPPVSLPQHSIERANKSVRPLTAAENRRHPGIFQKVGTAVDCRYREVELGTFSPAGQRHADRMEERFRFLPRTSLHLARDRAEAL